MIFLAACSDLDDVNLDKLLPSIKEANYLKNHILIFTFTFDQEGFAEAKAYKKPGKIYCSTFRGHRDSIIKRLVK